MTDGREGGAVARRFQLDSATVIPIGFLLTVAGGFVWAALWLTGHFDVLGSDIKDVKYRIERIEEHMQDRITRSDVENWIYRFYRANPTLQVVELPR